LFFATKNLIGLARVLFIFNYVEASRWRHFLVLKNVCSMVCFYVTANCRKLLLNWIFIFLQSVAVRCLESCKKEVSLSLWNSVWVLLQPNFCKWTFKQKLTVFYGVLITKNLYFVPFTISKNFEASLERFKLFKSSSE